MSRSGAACEAQDKLGAAINVRRNSTIRVAGQKLGWKTASADHVRIHRAAPSSSGARRALIR
jgi:hypothetical protein